MKKRLLTIFLALVFYIWNIACLAQPPVILVIGDSLSSGHGISLEQGWVHLLQIQLQNSGYPHQVINASVSGDTTANGLVRVGAALRDHQPAIVILELGGNDGLRATSVASVRDNLSMLIKTIKDHRAKILLAGIRLPPNYGPAYVSEFEQIYPRLAREFETELVPFFMDGVATKFEYMQADGVHPNVGAQPILLNNVWTHLEPMLQE